MERCFIGGVSERTSVIYLQFLFKYLMGEIFEELLVPTGKT